MRIAIFSDTFLPQVNGVASVAHQSAVTLGELGHDVCVFTVSKNNEKDFKSIAEGKFSVVTLPSVKAPAYPGERMTIPIGTTLYKVKKFNPQIIHTHTPFSVGWEAVWAHKLFKIPLVGTHHTFYDHYLRHVKMDYEWAKKPSWKYVVAYYNRCDLALSPSKSLANELISRGLKKPIEVLPNSVNVKLFKPIASEAAKKKLKAKFSIKGKSLVYMGRVSYEKSIDQVIEAFKLVVSKMPEVKLMIVGDGPERTYLEKLARELGVENKVFFTGFKHNNELVETLQANDIFLTASKSETFSLAVLEGMAVGLPIIAADALAVPELVKPDVNGFLAFPDNPGEMAERIMELILDERLLKKFGRNSRQLALDYLQEKIAKSLEDIYQKLLDNNQ